MLRVEVPALNENNPADQDLSAYLDEKRRHNPEWNSLRDERGRQIRARLEGVFHCKCGYCEDNQGASVEHFWPQSVLYPDGSNSRWDYQNFILACAGCQSAKGSQLPMADGDASVWMLNPRSDDPFLFLSFAYETGAAAARGASDSLTNQRGELTIQRLGLSWRGEKYNLNEARRRKWLDIAYYIKQVAEQSPDLPAAQEAWHNLREHLRPTAAYLGIIRQFLLD